MSNDYEAMTARIREILGYCNSERPMVEVLYELYKELDEMNDSSDKFMGVVHAAMAMCQHKINELERQGDWVQLNAGCTVQAGKTVE